VKAYEATQALRDGAQEVDMVLAIGALKSQRFGDVEADIRAVVDAVATAPGEGIVKVILETALLTDAEAALACVAARRAGADFVKTSTGFAAGGATLGHVALMRQLVGDALGVKAAGGVGSAEEARRMIAHGATRIGASGSVQIVTGEAASASY
jgi:deoxyribose-phosphate aldolase